MKRGIVLIAHNNDKDDYYGMAVYTAKRVNKFLDLPVTIITDSSSITDTNYSFDNTILVEPDKTNHRRDAVWINKGRYKIYEQTPYDDTLLIDTDYMINSNLLLNTFRSDTDFSCHKNIKWLMEGDNHEYFHKRLIPTHWATVLRFKRSNRVEQIFGMMEMIQTNYDHYAKIYKFMGHMYRNDYALTIALKTVNGHLENPTDYFNWRLLHAGLGVRVHRETDTRYVLIAKDKNTEKNEYIVVDGIDFHMLNKKNFMEIAV